MEEIERQYNNNIDGLERIVNLAMKSVQGERSALDIGIIWHDLEKAIESEKLYEIDRLKRSQGGKKSSANLTPEQRQERARKAGQSKKGK